MNALQMLPDRVVRTVEASNYYHASNKQSERKGLLRFEFKSQDASISAKMESLASFIQKELGISYQMRWTLPQSFNI
jgi:hypothetical protein